MECGTKRRLPTAPGRLGQLARQRLAVGENTVLYWNGRVWTRMQAGLQHYTDIHGDDGRHFWAVDAGGGVTSFTR